MYICDGHVCMSIIVYLGDAYVRYIDMVYDLWWCFVIYVSCLLVMIEALWWWSGLLFACSNYGDGPMVVVWRFARAIYSALRFQVLGGRSLSPRRPPLTSEQRSLMGIHVLLSAHRPLWRPRRSDFAFRLSWYRRMCRVECLLLFSSVFVKCLCRPSNFCGVWISWHLGGD